MTSGRLRRIDRILDRAYVESIDSFSAEELRRRRKECEDVEAVLSFQRRWLHGKLDILKVEMTRRADETIVDRLSDILGAEDAERRGTPRRGARAKLPATLPRDARRELDRLVGAEDLARLPELEPGELTELVDRLADAERKLSLERRGLLQVIDRLQDELVRRYKDGDASASDVLR